MFKYSVIPLASPYYGLVRMLYAVRACALRSRLLGGDFVGRARDSTVSLCSWFKSPFLLEFISVSLTLCFTDTFR